MAFSAEEEDSATTNQLSVDEQKKKEGWLNEQDATNTKIDDLTIDVYYLKRKLKDKKKIETSHLEGDDRDATLT